MKKWIFLFTCMLFTYAYANVRPVATFSLGGDSINPNMRQYLTIVRPTQNFYQGREANSKLFTGGFIGVEVPFVSWFLKQIEIVNPLFIQFGGSYYYTNAFKAGGSIFQSLNPSPSSEPTSPNKSYHYLFNIQNQRAFIEGKLLGLWPYHFDGFVSGGLGISQNKAYHYQQIPLQSTVDPTAPAFTHHTLTTPVFLIGVGIEKEIYSTDKIGLFRIGGGYRWVNLGLARLGPAPTQVELDNTFPTLGVQVHADEFVIQFTYLAPQC